MPPLDPGLLVVRDARQIDELVAHVDKGGALAAAAQIELEDLAVPVQRLVDVADLDRHMVDADQPGLLAVAHLILPRGRCRYLTPMGALRASGANKLFTAEDAEDARGRGAARRLRVLCASLASSAV